MTAGVTDKLYSKEQIEEWASKRADDAGRLSRQLLDTMRKNERFQWKPIATAPVTEKILLWWKGCKTPSKGQWCCGPEGEGWKCEGDRVIPVNQTDCTHWMRLPDGPFEQRNKDSAE